MRDNCVISEVRINKEKLQKRQHFKHSNKSQESSTFGTPVESREPTAPAWELGMSQSDCLPSSPLENNSKKSERTSRRNVAGGRLLEKRMSNQHFIYKPPSAKDPPQKPPRSSLSCEEGSLMSTVSTSLSVREAEKVLDKFLAEKGYIIPKISEEPPKDSKPNKSPTNTKSGRETFVGKDKLRKFQYHK